MAVDAAAGKQGERGLDGERRMLEGPIPEAELAAIAAESSQAERRADDAERELIEWKKIKFMQDRVGEDFDAIVLSCTKYGFFVELDDMFIEGLVPLTFAGRMIATTFRDTDRTIVGARTGHVFSWGSGCRCCWTGSTGSSGGCSLRCCRLKRRWRGATVVEKVEECGDGEWRASAFEPESSGKEGEDEGQGSGAG